MNMSTKCWTFFKQLNYTEWMDSRRAAFEGKKRNTKCMGFLLNACKQLVREASERGCWMLVVEEL